MVYFPSLLDAKLLSREWALHHNTKELNKLGKREFYALIQQTMHYCCISCVKFTTIAHGQK